MKFGIQRRGILVTPPEGLERTWLWRQFDQPEIASMFGVDDGLGAAARNAYKSGRVITGIIRRAQDRRRVGFAVMLAPSEEAPFWEIAAAIPEQRYRDGYTMLHTVDIMAHYTLDHVKVALVGARVRTDNRASDAVVRRIGYEKVETRAVAGHDYDFYQLTPERWAARRARLERGEEEHPSGIGGAFVRLAGPPWLPAGGTPP
jgi:RimJ/RimL family protein N-acetyltransferase